MNSKINRKLLTELLHSARTGTGLCENQNEDGHAIRDAWVHSMLTKKLPDAIELLLAELDRAESYAK